MKVPNVKGRTSTLMTGEDIFINQLGKNGVILKNIM